MNKRKILNQIRERRKKRARAKIFGTAENPRLSVFRSNRCIYVQLIDDKDKKTLISASTSELPKSEKTRKLESAAKLGELIAKKSIEKGVKKALFDRGKYKYHGRIKAVAEGARKAGLEL